MVPLSKNYRKILLNGSAVIKGTVRILVLQLNIATKRVEKRYCAFSRSLIKPVLQQIRLLQVDLQFTTRLLLRFTGLRQTRFAAIDVIPV